VLAFVVLCGRLAVRTRVNAPEQMDALAAATAQLAPAFTGQAMRPEEVDGTTILAAWLRDRGETEGCVLRIADTSVPATQRAEWRAACASLLAPLADWQQSGAPQPQQERQQDHQPDGTAAAVSVDRAAAAPG
jgi:hypothetical protein